MSEITRDEKVRSAWQRAQTLLEPRYKPSKIIGMGGMSVVIAAVHQTLGTEVAIKLLDESLLTDTEAKARFIREAKIAARIKHPNIVPVRDVDDAHGFIVMERIDGISLKEKIRKGGPLPAEEVLKIARVILQALGTAHDDGVIHRDVKPANILLAHDGKVWLTDFGVAFLSDSELTQTGTTMGTPAYMSPEQLRGYTVDPRADIYALGASLFEALTGRRLHGSDGETLPAAAELRDVGTPQLNRAILGALEEDPKLRLGDTKAFIEILDAPAKEMSESEETSRQDLTADSQTEFPVNFQAEFSSPPKAESSKVAISLSAILILASIILIAFWISGGRPITKENRAPKNIASSPTAMIAMLPFQDKSKYDELGFSKGGLPFLLGQELKRIEGIEIVGHYRLQAFVKEKNSTIDDWRKAAAEQGATYLTHGEIRPTFAHAQVELNLFLEDLQGNRIKAWAKKVSVRAVPKTVRGWSDDIAQEILGRDVRLDVSQEVFEFQRAYLAGVAAMEAHLVDDAFEYFKSAIRINPASGIAHYRLALATWWAGKSLEETKRYAKRAEALGLTRPQEMFLTGLALLMDRNHFESIEYFEKALKKYPKDRDLLYGQYEALFHGGQPAKSLEIYKTLAQLHPHFRLGVIHALTFSILHGRTDDIRWALRQAKVHQDAHHKLWELKAKFAAGQRKEAAEGLQELSEEYIDRPTSDGEATLVRDALVATYAVMGQLDLAQALLSPEQVVAKYALRLARGLRVDHASLVVKRDQLEPHIQVQGQWLSFSLIEWLQGHPSMKASAVESAGAIQLALFNNLKVRVPKHAEIEAIAGALEATANDEFRKAIKAWTSVIKHAGDSTYVTLAHFKTAEAQRHLGEWSQVIRHCEEVRYPRLFSWTWGPTIGPCLLWLAEAYQNLGQPEQAQAAVRSLKLLRADAGSKDSLVTAAEQLIRSSP